MEAVYQIFQEQENEVKEEEDTYCILYEHKRQELEN